MRYTVFQICKRRGVGGGGAERRMYSRPFVWGHLIKKGDFTSTIIRGNWEKTYVTLNSALYLLRAKAYTGTEMTKLGFRL